eukprot:157672-Rhodomonas_salina.3
MQQRSAVLALVSAAAVLCVVGWSRSGRSVVVLQSTTGREQELNALDDYRYAATTILTLVCCPCWARGSCRGVCTVEVYLNLRTDIQLLT